MNMAEESYSEGLCISNNRGEGDSRQILTVIWKPELSEHMMLF